MQTVAVATTAYALAAGKAVIATLRRAGYAILTFSPGELVTATPESLQNRMLELGNEVISDLQDFEALPAPDVVDIDYDRAAITAMRLAGYAVVLFAPSELGSAKPESLQNRLVELGNEVILDLQSTSLAQLSPSLRIPNTSPHNCIRRLWPRLQRSEGAASLPAARALSWSTTWFTWMARSRRIKSARTPSSYPTSWAPTSSAPA